MELHNYQRQTIDRVKRLGQSVQKIIIMDPSIFDDDKTNDGQKPEPDFLCACNGKACGGVCQAKSGHFRGGDADSGGCTAAYRPPKPKDAHRPRR